VGLSAQWDRQEEQHMNKHPSTGETFQTEGAAHEETRHPGQKNTPMRDVISEHTNDQFFIL
jgi:hypothetical protein